MSVVLQWRADEQRPGWLGLLAARLFALRARMQDGDAADREAISPTEQRLDIPTKASNPQQPPKPPELPEPGERHDAAFDAFFAQHERALYGYLRRMLPTHDAALDVAQEAFFRAWQRFETLRGYDRPQAWLFRVATNLALDTLRRRQPIDLSRLLGRRDATGADDTSDAAGDTFSALTDPFDMEQSLEQRDLVNRALARVPERQRAAVLLWAAHGLTIAEIAEAFETTEVNVRQLLSRGRVRFRELYEQARQET